MKNLSKEDLKKSIVAASDDPMQVLFWFDTLYHRYEMGRLTQQQIFDMLTSNTHIPEESQQ